MKLVTEYLADAANFEQLAALEQDPQVREQLKKPLPKPPVVGSKEPGVGSST